MADKNDLSSSLSLEFVEGLYDEYLHDPASVSADWKTYFDGMGRGNGDTAPRITTSPSPTSVSAPHVAAAAVATAVAHTHPRFNGKVARCAICGRAEELAALQHRVDQLIRNYRVRGHRIASLNPLGADKPEFPELTPEYHGLGPEHMDQIFASGTLAPEGSATLREIIARLRETYCRSIGVQFMHIDSMDVRAWLQDRMEPAGNRIQLDRSEQIRILT
ncbi:MAG: 2-oxoglutarate dehydrogenase E1 component, partial [Candidatus Hydrogenedentes bacterium]|nr:2-oxoglutarate dehydrogenase E1 component [Candidatus Hydrogenedentota bacterium]